MPASGATCASASSGQSGEQLVGARHPLARREARARVGDDRPPAEQLRGAAERLGGVDGAVDEEARRRREDVGEDLSGSSSVEQRGCGRAGAPSRSSSGIVELARRRPRRRRRVSVTSPRLAGLGSSSTKTSISPPHGRPISNAISSVIPYVSEARRPAGEHVLRGEDDVALDAAARDGAGELAAVADGELRADRPRRGTARRDDGRDRDLRPSLAPASMPCCSGSSTRSMYLPCPSTGTGSCCARRSTRSPSGTTARGRRIPRRLFDDLVELAELAPAARDPRDRAGNGEGERRARARGFARHRRRAVAGARRGGAAQLARSRGGDRRRGLREVGAARAEFDAVVAFTAFHWIAPGAALCEAGAAAATGRRARRRADAPHVLPAGRRPVLGRGAGGLRRGRPASRQPSRRRRRAVERLGATRSRRLRLFERVEERRQLMGRRRTPPTSTSPCSARTPTTSPSRRAARRALRRIHARIAERPGGTVTKTLSSATLTSG